MKRYETKEYWAQLPNIENVKRTFRKLGITIRIITPKILTFKAVYMGTEEQQKKVDEKLKKTLLNQEV